MSESAGEERFRWQGAFQQSSDPVFVLNRRRRVLFVNRAWEAITGLALAEVKGQACRRRPRGILAGKIEAVLSAMAPPLDAVESQPTPMRRHVAIPGAAPMIWQVAFFPLMAAEGTLALLGRIKVLARPEPVAGQAISEKLLALRDRHAARFLLDQLPHAGTAMNRVVAQVRLAAQSAVPVTIVVPAGTGKAWLARAIHQQSSRRLEALASLDCRRLSPRLIEDILFSDDLRMRPRVAALYLHAPELLPRELQDRLATRLEAQQDGGDFPRVLAGMQMAPEELIASGKLLPALAHRLGLLAIALPPLRERLDDLPFFIEHFLARSAEATGREPRPFSPEALDLLRLHPWPGNLRELYEVVGAAVTHAKGARIEPGDLPFYLTQMPTPPAKPLPLDAILEQVERRMIVQALKLAGNNKSKAAELLAIWRPRLLRRMEALGIADAVAGDDPGEEP